MNRSKSPPVNLEKYLEGKRHRFCTYAQKTALVDLDILDDYIENECNEEREDAFSWNDDHKCSGLC